MEVEREGVEEVEGGEAEVVAAHQRPGRGGPAGKAADAGAAAGEVAAAIARGENARVCVRAQGVRRRRTRVPFFHGSNRNETLE